MTNPNRKLRLWLIGLVAANVAAYALVIAAKSILGDGNIPSVNPLICNLTALSFIGATILTWLAVRNNLETLARGGKKVMSTVAVASAVIMLTAIFLPPIGSADNYWNALMARSWTIYGRNPYSTSAAELSSDPLFPSTAKIWSGVSMPYGPIWTLYSTVPTALVREPLAAAVAMKFFTALAYAAAGALLYLGLRRVEPSRAGIASAFWLLCPAGIFEAANAGHNEGLLAVPLVALALALKRRRPDWALPAVTTAVFIKFWPLVFLPSLLALRRTPLKSWLKGLALAAIPALSLLVFWPHGRLYMPWMSELYLPGSFAFGHFLWWLTAVSQGWPPRLASQAATNFFSLVLATVAVWAGWRSWQNRIDPNRACLVLSIVAVMVCLNWLNPWYTLALLPFALLAARNPMDGVSAAAALGGIGLAYYLTLHWGLLLALMISLLLPTAACLLVRELLRGRRRAGA